MTEQKIPQEILFWKRELRRLSQEFLRRWKKCPRCGSKWADIAWDAESDHEILLVECRSGHLFRADDQFWLFDCDDYSDAGVYVPSKESTTTEVSAYA
jgi:hypothetical protein